MLKWTLDFRFEHLVLFVVGDFDNDADLRAAALSAGGSGVRVLALGSGSAAAKKALRAGGIDVDAVGRSRKKAEAYLGGMFGVWDAMLVSPGWRDLVAGDESREREQAFLDVRAPRPIVRMGDPEYRLLRTPGAWAAFTLARAGGANKDQAKQFARQQSRGHKKKTGDGGTGRGDRKAKAARGRLG